MTVSINGTTGLITAGSSSSGGGGVASNTALGGDALVANTTGASNTAIGNEALKTNTTASQNTAVGYQAGYSNTTGDEMTASGYQALYANTTGQYNSAFGLNALRANTTGSSNTSLGNGSLRFNTTASNNTAVGYQAGYSNTTGGATAFGQSALRTNTTGLGNVGLGNSAGYSMASNNYSTYVGHFTGYNTTGGGNTFIGNAGSDGSAGCGFYMTTGANNTIIGGYTGNQGGLDIRTANAYIVLSDGLGTPRLYITGSGNVNQIFCPAVYDWTTANSANVVVTGSSGHLVRSTSALKYKQDIRDLESIDINKFRPVRYKSKSSSDDQTKDYFGFIADEVDAAGVKELVQYGLEGEVEGFSYDRLTAVLVKTIQDLQKRIEILENK